MILRFQQKLGRGMWLRNVQSEVLGNKGRPAWKGLSRHKEAWDNTTHSCDPATTISKNE
jgi:hypothetical protein